MNRQSLGLLYAWPGLELTQCEHGATRVRQHPVDGAVVCQILKGQAIVRAKNDQPCSALISLRKDFDGRVAMNHLGLDCHAASGACLRGKPAQLVQGG
jgi:hypothetical protein